MNIFFEKKLQKKFDFWSDCCKLILVGYRGKMFYLSDLLFHVIGLG